MTCLAWKMAISKPERTRMVCTQALLLLMLFTIHAIDATFLTETALDRIEPVLPHEFVLIPLMQGR